MASKEHLHRIRFLTIALFFSGSINIILVAFFFFWTFYDRPMTPYFEHKTRDYSEKMIRHSNADILKHYKAKTYDQLIPLLSKFELAQDGFTERDLALGVLMTFHEFDLERALGPDYHHLQKRMLSFDEGRNKVTVFPHLSKSQFESIINFVKTEKWPFKPKGIFLRLKQSSQDHSLYEAFYSTQEFASLDLLFRGKGVKKEELARMALEGNWGILSTVHEKQKKMLDPRDENRQKVLLTYINEGSEIAASLLLKIDFDFASKQLNDSTILTLIRLLKTNNSSTIKFLNMIATSSRGDLVKTSAADRYQEITGRSWEPLVSREVAQVNPKAMVNFSKEQVIQPQIKKNHLYIIQDGDSLWKIAKRFKVSIEEVRSLNNLKSDSLKPGAPLKIPDHT